MASSGTARTRVSAAKKNWRRWWPWLAAGLVLLLLCLGWFLTPLRQWMQDLQSWLLGLGVWGVVIFAAILVLGTFLPAPDWPLPIVAGYIYGFWAFPLTYLSIAIASTAAFLGARYLARDRMLGFLGRHPKYRTFDKIVAKEGWQVVILLRLSPIVPFNLQNYALGVTGIPFMRYFGATLIGIVPGIAIYVYFGVFGKGLGNGPGVLDWVLLGVGALATVALALLVARRTKALFGNGRRSRK
jgi:uncharacterized membrane protein YdjX (TVP38/TMEM64 family)